LGNKYVSKTIGMEQPFENENNIMKNGICEILMNETIMEEVPI